MTFIGGFFTGVFLTLGLILLLLFVAKALGFTMVLRSEWRDAHGYYSNPYRASMYFDGGYGCRKCWYHDFYDRHRTHVKLNTEQPKAEEITEDELNDILNGSEVPEDEEEPIE